MGINTTLPPNKILTVFFVISFLSLFPFMVVDLNIAHNTNMKVSSCVGLGYVGNYVTLFLGQWIFNDGYIKLAVLVFVLFCLVVSREIRNRSDLVSCCGTLLTFYYIFELGWLIAGAVLFWGHPQNVIVSPEA